MAFTIQNALKRREQDIQNALDEARKARQEMTKPESRRTKLVEAGSGRTRRHPQRSQRGENSIIEEPQTG